LGSNETWQGLTSAELLNAALKSLSQLPQIEVVRVSRFYQTASFPAGSGPDFVNAAALIRSRLPAEGLLSALHQVESDFGRRRIKRWGARCLDLDLLFCADAVVPDTAEFRRWYHLDAAQQRNEAPGTLILPHPRLHERAFVLGPLMEIAPEWCHPVLGLSVAQMFEALPKALRAELRAL
jgi:2-amino-4-hydroxy-6-hydroxymethyldihydropteridine diphosphokinase